MDTTDNSDWDIEINAKNSLISFKLNDVWHYRDLLVLLVRRDFVSFYKQTILGPIWFFVQPVITIIFYSFVFGNLAGIPTDGIPQPVFYLAGIIIWNYFADCLIKTSTVFKDNAALMGKVYFPRLVMPLSIIVSNLVRFSVQFLLFIILIIIYCVKGMHFNLNAYALLLPVLILLIAFLGLGLGLLISSVTTKYRDLAFVVSFGVPLLMYTTTVVYPLSVVMHKFAAYSWLIKANPVTGIIEFFRYGFLGKGSHDWSLLLYSGAITALILLGGIIVFNKVEKSFIDTI